MTLAHGNGTEHFYVQKGVVHEHGHRYVTKNSGLRGLQRQADLDPTTSPWAATVSRAQGLLKGSFPDLYRPLPNEQSPRSHALRQILRANGHSDADNAFVMTHPHPEWRRSQVVSAPDQYGDYHPGVALHPERNDYGTLAHEAGHLLHHDAAGIDAHGEHDDELKHGPDFLHHYQRALEVAHPGAGQFLGEVWPRIHNTIERSNARWGTRLTPEEFASERPHGAAVAQAQDAARWAAPTMGLDLGKSEDATSAVQHMMRRGGHPDADEAFVMKHPNPGWEQSQAFFSDGQPGISLHPDRWDYGTAAHEVAHHLHEVELGHHPRSDEEAHGPDFIRHYQNVLGDFGPDAARVLGETYHQSLGRFRRQGATEMPDWADDEFTAKGGHKYYTVTEPKAVTMRTPSGSMAGYVNWGDNDVIGNMQVREQHQRRGLATELLRRAREQRPQLQHSDRLSGDAQKWLTGIGEKQAVTDKWPPYLTERPDEYGDMVPVNVSRHNPRGPVGTEEEARQKGWAGPYYHGTSKRRARDIRQNGFRQPRMPNWEMKDYGTQEEVDHGNTHRTFFADNHQDAHDFARAQHGDNADVVTAYLHPDHLTTEEGGGFMDSTQVKDVAHAMAIRPSRRTGKRYPTEDSVQRITKNYAFADGPDWPTVRDNYVPDAPTMRSMREDIRQNGIKKPIPVDYDQSPPKILDGHTRLFHAEALGMDKVPVRHVTEDDHRWESASPDDGHYTAPREHVDHSSRYEQWARDAAAEKGHELGAFEPHPKVKSLQAAKCVHCGAEAFYSSFGKVGGAAIQNPHVSGVRSTSSSEKVAARFTPHQRLFGPTQGLDHRLFDGEHLKPAVREYIISTLSTFWEPLFGECGWEQWAIVYFAGSEASEWTSPTLEGNNDFDVLIGVDYQKFRGCQSRTSKYQAMSDEEITADINKGLRVLDEQTAAAMIPVDGILTGPWSNTWYVNQDSYDIRAIKPYAAYDVTHDRWAVKPPHLENWTLEDFPEGHALVLEARAVAAYVRAILKLPEPYRTQQGFALWNHLHSDRSRAFGPQGEGWYDPGNVLEKWLDQAGLWEKLVEIMVRARQHPESLNAPANWGNDPRNVT